MNIGAVGSVGYKGVLDDVRVYDRALRRRDRPPLQTRRDDEVNTTVKTQLAGSRWPVQAYIAADFERQPQVLSLPQP